MAKVFWGGGLFLLRQTWPENVASSGEMLLCLQCSFLFLYCRLVYQVSHLHDWLMSVCVWVCAHQILNRDVTERSLKGWSSRPRGILALLSRDWVWGMLVSVLRKTLEKDTKTYVQRSHRCFHIFQESMWGWGGGWVKPMVNWTVQQQIKANVVKCVLLHRPQPYHHHHSSL